MEKSNKRLSQESATPLVVSSSSGQHNAEEIFTLIGDWNVFYLKVIALNSFIVGVARMDRRIYDLWRIGENYYNFYDCDGILYKRLGSHNDSDLEHLHPLAVYARNIGSIFGCFLCAWFASRYQPRVGILFGAVIYFGGGLLLYHNDIIYMFPGWFLIRCGSQLTQILPFIHCIECVPSHVRPLAVGLMLINEYMLELILLMSLLKSPFWKVMKLAIPSAVFCMAFVNFYASPPSILFALGQGDAITIKKLIKYVAPGSENIIDMDYLVGDILYRGQISFSRFTRFLDTFKIRPFTFKLIILSILSMAREASDVLYIKATRTVLPIGYMEIEMVTAIFKTLAMVVALIILFTFGRRVMVLLFCLCVMWANNSVFAVEHDNINICDTYFKPKMAIDTFLSIFGILLGNIAVDIGNVVLLLLMAEHIPTVNRALFLPVMYGVKEFAGMIQYSILKHVFKWVETTEAITIVLMTNTVAVMVLTPTVMYVDNTQLMPTTTADLPCYYRPRMEYTKTPFLDDRSDDPTSNSENLCREK